METKILEAIRYLGLDYCDFYYTRTDGVQHFYIKIDKTGKCVIDEWEIFLKKEKRNCQSKEVTLKELSEFVKNNILEKLKKQVTNKIKNDIIGFTLF